MRILIIKMSSLGDICHTLPALQALRNHWPESELVWLCNTEYVSWLQELAPVDRVLGFDRQAFRHLQQWPRALRSSVELIAELRAGAFDLVLDFQALLRSGVLSWLTGASRRLGFAGSREGTLFYSRRCRGPLLQHPIWKNLSLLASLMVKAELLPALTAPDPVKQRVRERLAGTFTEQPIVLLPSSRWPSKTWPKAHWLELIAKLRGLPLLVLGSDDPKLRGTDWGAAVSWLGQTSLIELTALLGEARLVLGADTGPLHLAAYLERPVIGIYGPTTFQRTYPLGGQNVIVLAKELPCLACRQRTCPIPEHPCMLRASPQTLARLVLERIGGDICEDLS